jgi:NAD+ kinase
MNLAFKTIALIGRRYTEGVTDTLNALVDYLHSLNAKIFLEEETAHMLRHNKLPTIHRDKLHGHCDLIIVVGGDGSLLSAARIAVDQHIPVLGVNRGSLGFLTDINPDEIETIGEILSGKFSEEERFLLDAKFAHENHVITHDKALNDVVLLPSEINRMIEFSVYIDKQFVCKQKADGMIVATPTGSTAHALSGGGPILHPNLDAIVLVPMFPHTLTSRPIVVKGDSVIELIMSEDCNACPNISCDGQEFVPIPLGSKVKIHKHPQKLRLIHSVNYNYYETLRVKLNWQKK